MISIDEMQEMLEELIEEVPEPFFKELNGGVNLLADRKLSKEALDEDLFTMGEYHYDGSMGRYIVIYYGSFCELCQGMSVDEIREELRETLFHEFTHHLEDLAGEYGLKVKDVEELQEYLMGKRGQ